MPKSQKTRDLHRTQNAAMAAMGHDLAARVNQGFLTYKQCRHALDAASIALNVAQNESNGTHLRLAELFNYGCSALEMDLAPPPHTPDWWPPAVRKGVSV